MILSLPSRDQAQDRWQRAAAMLMTAAETGRPDHISIAEAQLERALTDPTQSSVRLAGDVSKKPPARSIRRRTVGATSRA
jgi:predicted aldo/keto reductase-like oxidoreductase